MITCMHASRYTEAKPSHVPSLVHVLWEGLGMRLLYSNWSHSGLCSFHIRSNEAESMQCMGVRSVTCITEVK